MKSSSIFLQALISSVCLAIGTCIYGSVTNLPVSDIAQRCFFQTTGIFVFALSLYFSFKLYTREEVSKMKTEQEKTQGQTSKSSEKFKFMS